MSVLGTLIYSSMLGMLLLALLQAVNKPRQRQTTYLIALLALLIVHVCGELVVYSGAYRYVPWLVGAQFPVRVLLGPALYFYACATMSPNPEFSKRTYAWALSGPILVMAVMAPFVSGLTSAEKLALADPATRDPQHYKLALFSCFASTQIFVLYTAVYFISALKLHTRHRQQLMERFSDIESRSISWFAIILLLWGLVWLCYATGYISVFLGWRWFGQGVILPIFEACVLLAFAYLALKQPILTPADKGEPRARQPRTSTVSLDRMQRISAKLEKAMEEDQLFMEEDLSLNKLSSAIGVSENHISETLSQLMQTNFFQFVNRYRISQAEKLLKETDMQVSSIQFEVGFNSKSTFNTAFKKATGLTPSLYRKQQHN
ncbi:AraC family transcriptional regulator [Pseudoalteromonas sp. R3]|uniref:helix-turn-helix domain-containing protein n=1 Tax=Pseudoalteromonas sp. R3 TaxID=1709477 RepID=UPI0006B48664|nr:AraC family transcriptional regulator [Pseudoalteromonas sp. R3]AZZ97831.1 AraC family transcriptional regulator [Pseudoalteromonas sp. R3]